MVGYRQGKFIYLMIPKNASTTFAEFFEAHHWEKFQLSYNEDYRDCIVFGHIQDPGIRHVKGISQYLMNTFVDWEDRVETQLRKLKQLTDDEVYAKLLVSGVFDQHTYPVTAMLAGLKFNDIHWIPMDFTMDIDPSHPTYLSERLTNMFFKEHQLDIEIAETDRKNIAGRASAQVREIVADMIRRYPNEHGYFTANMLNLDIEIYNKTLQEYHKKIWRQ